jgi:hypothetical protein
MSGIGIRQALDSKARVNMTFLEKVATLDAGAREIARFASSAGRRIPGLQGEADQIIYGVVALLQELSDEAISALTQAEGISPADRKANDRLADEIVGFTRRLDPFA